jgi:hypothetical protein
MPQKLIFNFITAREGPNGWLNILWGTYEGVGCRTTPLQKGQRPLKDGHTCGFIKFLGVLAYIAFIFGHLDVSIQIWTMGTSNRHQRFWKKIPRGVEPRKPWHNWVHRQPWHSRRLPPAWPRFEDGPMERGSSSHSGNSTRANFGF